MLNLKKLSLSAKLALGFGTVICISAIVGFIVNRQMGSVQNKTTILADEYMPEVIVAADMRGATNRAMYAMRGFGLSLKPSFLENAKSEISKLKKSLVVAHQLDAKALHLKKLAGQLKVWEQSLSKYEDLVDKTKSSADSLLKLRKKLDEAAAKYMANSQKFLLGQQEKYQTDLSERLRKISVGDSLQDASSTARVLNFKSQATNDRSLMEKAIALLDAVPKERAKILDITRMPKDLQRLQTIVDEAKDYQIAMQDFLIQTEKDSSDEEALKKIRTRMDEAASKYVKNVEGFVDDQAKALESDMRGRMEKVRLAGEIRYQANQIRVAAFKAQALGQPALIDKASDNFTNLNSLFDQLAAISVDPKDIKRIENIRSASNTYGQALTSVKTEWQTLQQLGVGRDRTGKELIAASKTIADAAITNTQGTVSELKSVATNTSNANIFGQLFAAAISVVIAFLISLGISRDIKTVIASLEDGATQVTDASGSVSTTSQHLADGASRQATSLAEISSSINQVLSMTRHNADHASNAEESADRAGSAVGLGKEAIVKMFETIEQIKASADESANIISTIDRLASQTNLLALNAAVEAARAGKAGESFSVVAEEVRGLAQRSAEAANETAQLIAGAQNFAKQGVAVSSEVQDLLENIVTSVEEVVSTVRQVATDSQQQSQFIEKVSSELTQMDELTHTTASSAQESATAAEQLVSQAGELSDIVSALTDIVGNSNSNSNSGHAVSTSA